jgi:hypothetical protein
VAVGKAVQGYYPAVIKPEEEGLWYSAQAAKTMNFRKKGVNGAKVNLFKGLIKNAHDGETMQAFSCPKSGGVRERRLVSYGHIRAVPNSDPVSIRYDEFEKCFLTFLEEVSANDLQIAGSLVADLASAEQELRGLTERQKDIQNLLTQPAYKDVAALADAARKLQPLIEDAQATVEGLRQRAYTDRPVAEARTLSKLLANSQGEEENALRLRLRVLLGNLIEGIYIKPEKLRNRRVKWIAQIFFTNGLCRELWSPLPVTDNNPLGEMRVCTDYGPTVVDLRDSSAARAVRVFDETAADDAPVVVPEDLQGALQAWMRDLRRRIGKESFKTVPAKVKAFLHVVGDMPAVSMDSLHWKRYVAWIRRQVRRQVLAVGTARIALNRIKEALNWLADQGRLERFPELSRSAASYIKR